MRDKYIKLLGLSTICISVLLSASICFALRQNFASIDLVKILNAQAFYASKLVSKNPQNKHWIGFVKEINSSMRKTISQIAGQDTIVLVSPAVVQGVEDITDRVLVALGLPSNPPSLHNFVKQS